MHTDPTRIRRGPVLGFLLIVFALFALAIISMGANAQTTDLGGYTRCGVEATGIDPWLRDRENPGGKTVTAARPGMAVSPEGRWFSCQFWVPQGGDPRMPEPSPEKLCPTKDTYEWWEVDGRLCTSIPPGEYTGTTTKLVAVPAGRVRYIVSNPEWTKMGKSTHGSIVFRCVARPDGSVEWQAQPGATCRWANE